jgi:glycosyltransferase involved in cell wall biosynthesis
MRVVVSTPVQAHSFDLAKELKGRGCLTALFSGYPRRKLALRGLTGPEVRSYPLPVVAGLGLCRVFRGEAARLAIEPWPKILFDVRVARAVPDCDLFVATSSAGLFSGRKAKGDGAFWVCDRPSSHPLNHDRIMREEYSKRGLRWPGVHRRVVERELREYQESDAILVPSSFAERSFTERGVDPAKLWRVPYGVDLSAFRPVAVPEAGRLDLLFVGALSLRKGLPYLLEAYRRVSHPRKSLTLIGLPRPETRECLAEAADDSTITVLGVLPQSRLKDYMSRAHLLVLPSLEEGLALVQVQALACGCPILGTYNSGAEDIIAGGSAGRVAPPADSDALAGAIQCLADAPEELKRMRKAALAASGSERGWPAYANCLLDRYSRSRLDNRKGAPR